MLIKLVQYIFTDTYKKHNTYIIYTQQADLARMTDSFMKTFEEFKHNLEHYKTDY